jgi:methionyl-tRNA synthetase
VGKDILRFHAVYWPAFLLSAGISPPSQVWAHGWLTINGEKMSKRLKNFIPSGPLVETFGADVVRYYLTREVAFGQDGDFSHKNVLARYNGELANGLGNLLNRMIASIVKNNLGGVVPTPPASHEPVDEALVFKAKQAAQSAAEHLDNIAPHRALDAIWELVAAANKYVDETAPWALAKQGHTERLSAVAYNTLEALRWLSLMIAPFMPGKAAGLRAQLGLEPRVGSEGRDSWPSVWGELPGGTVTKPGDALFPRVDAKREAEILSGFGLDAEGKPPPHAEAASPTKKSKKSAAKTPPDGFLNFDDFLKVELKVGEILAAEALPKSDKLLKLQIDLGEDQPRQVLAGIREHYQPEDLIGKRVAVVANLAPRKIMGVESQGMVLAAKDDEHGLSVLTVEKAIAAGTRVT